MSGAPDTAPCGADALSEFLAALRRPLDYLSSGGAAAARTQIAGRQLAARGRELIDRLDGPRGAAVEALCRELERLEAAATAAERVTRAAACRGLAEALAGQATGPAEPPPSYVATTPESLAAALAELGRPVQFARDVGPARAPHLRKFGIETIEDLLYHLPFRYEDRRQMCDIASAPVGEEVGIVGELAHLSERSVGRGGRRRILEGVLRDASGLLGLTWYNGVKYFATRFKHAERVLVYGKIERSPGGGKRIVHPDVELQPDEAIGAGILPIYQKPTSMTVGTIRKIVQQAAAKFAPLVPAVLPPAVVGRAGVGDPGTALAALHAPPPDADVARLNHFATAAHRALVFDELFFLQLGLGLKRRQALREQGLALPRSGALTERLAAALPFALTGAQQRVIEQVYADMARPHPMHRLVQGDVGSGKTMVALFAALVAIENGWQAAFMAPTELLAEQHHATLARFAAPLGVRSALLTADALRAAGKKKVYAALESGEIQLAVGTHALIQAGVSMPRLALGVIDEQHRFGVLQRAALAKLRGDGGPAPDILLMTATPIPRTLAMTVYGDLDVSLLDELPPGRKPVRTAVVFESRRKEVYERVKAQLALGRQAYIVYPLVEASEKEDLRDATSNARELGATVFAGLRVGLLHGRMKADEKDAVMRAFRNGDLQVLFSTTVIEVGVDVPNATIMVVEHAERFGLSQLHQLRGRVGRGSEEASCILVARYLGDQESDTYKRLITAMRGTTDGFKIAEIDLELRGPGDFLGTRQHGLPDFRVASLIRDTRTLAEAREAAEQWLTLDPHLRSPESQPLRQVLEHRWKGRLGLAEIG
ncbi:MAG: ATP-dependent DNA helicase RecG [Deltaproteobacteria bacterium]|nr:ATP-dependent DNA helicase RecG [Deltaproteobacteria bacterium]